jgi:ABC-type transport system involved in multi-copper enzyme maturation permease subunit
VEKQIAIASDNVHSGFGQRTSLWWNPIFSRELRGRLRSSKTASAILVVAAVASLLVLLRWPSDATVDRVSQGTQLVFRPLAFGLTLAIMMLVPAFPATSLVSERKRGTLALLFGSPTSPLKLYLGKLLSNVTLAMLLISVSLPAVAACYAMGGVSLRDHIGPLLIVLITMSVQYSAIGLWVSARAGSADSSLRTTYALVLALAVLSMGPLVVIGNLSGMYATLARWLTTISPISALLDITGGQATAAGVGISSGWVEFLIASAVITLGVAVATLRQLDPLRLDRPRPTGLVTGKGTNQGGMWRRVAYLVDPQRRKSGIPWWLNPVMVKEFRTRRFGRLHWLIRLVALCAIISLLLTVVAATGTVSWGVERIAGPLVLMQIALLLLVGPSLGASLIAQEIESGGWEVLRATPVSTWRVLTGKVMSVVWTMLLVLLATLPGYAVMSFIQPAMSGQVSNVIISLLVAVAMVVSISACVSGFSRSAASATATAYGILLALFVGTLLVWLARGNPFGPVLVERILMFNPAAAALSEMNTPGFERYSLAPSAWWIGGWISLGCLVALAIRIWRLTQPD